MQEDQSSVVAFWRGIKVASLGAAVHMADTARRGTPGAIERSYFTASVCGLQSPCLTRWPGRIPKGWSSNEMVHQVGLFTTPDVTNLITDPKERERYNQRHLHYWVLGHARRLVRVFEATVRGEPLIPARAPLAAVPRAKQSRRIEKAGA